MEETYSKAEVIEILQRIKTGLEEMTFKEMDGREEIYAIAANQADDLLDGIIGEVIDGSL